MSDAERPILFSAPMVRAILAGTKTMTRRVIKPQPDRIHDGEPYWNIGGYRAYQVRSAKDILRMGTNNPLVCPYGTVGTRLWVRESWAYETDFGTATGSVLYRADGDHRETERGQPTDRWRASIFMPRWASRITLEITSVKVERVQDICEEEAVSEGAAFCNHGVEHDGRHYRCGFRVLWDSLNDERGFGWDKNPWVWCVSFRRVKP